MSKDAVAVLEGMGLPAKKIVEGVKAQVARASHKGADGKMHKPSGEVIRVFVKEHLQNGYFEQARNWMIEAIAEEAS